MTKKYRSILLAVTALSVLASEACGKKLPDHRDQATAAAVFQETVAEMNGERILAEPAKDSAELLPADRIYRIFYEEAKKTGASYDLKTTEHMVASLGKNGYAAVDSGNQVNMEGADQVLEFCKRGCKNFCVYRK